MSNPIQDLIASNEKLEIAMREQALCLLKMATVRDTSIETRGWDVIQAHTALATEMLEVADLVYKITKKLQVHRL